MTRLNGPRAVVPVALGALALGCSLDTTTSGRLPGPAYDVHVMKQTSLDEQGLVGRFELRRVTLNRIIDFDKLTGPNFVFKRGGLGEVNFLSGCSLSQCQWQGGGDPKLRYEVVDGAAVPRDYATLVMFSAAHDFELVFDQVQSATGVSTTEMVAEFGRLETFFEPEVRVNGDPDVVGALRLNALFSGSGGQIALARRSRFETIPLATDVKVIAHEVGHLIFQLSFFEGREQVCAADDADLHLEDAWFKGRLASEFAIAGLNEGFADWHGFAITRGINTLGNQEGFETAERDITRDDLTWDTLPNDEDEAKASSDLPAVYGLGALFSRSLYRTFIGLGNDPESAEARHAFSVPLVDALRTTQALMRQQNLLPLPDATVAACESREYLTPAMDAPIVGAFFQAWLGALPLEIATPLCAELVSRFGDGFPEQNRVTCGGG